MLHSGTDSQSRHVILVVDDAAEVLRSIRALLSREGHTVLTAASGDEALALFKQHEVHLLLLDYFMPGMTTAELIRSVRDLDPFVQIVLQTGYADERPARTMMAELDIQGYHDKSDGPEKLLVWVDAGLKTHRRVTGLRERERLRNELVANVSHELCSPLHIISGYTELLREGEFGELPPIAARPLRSIAEATHALSTLVVDFLRYAKIESGVTELNQHRVATAELARELKRLASFLLEGKGVSCNVDLEGAPVALLTDCVKVRTILRNLVTNAAKFTARGEITLRFCSRGETLRVTVSDTGVGIAPEDRERIFDPFRQLDEPLEREQRGVGLGLALSRRLARILDGDLEVESEIGVGSTFTLVLPGTVVAGPEVHEPKLAIRDHVAHPVPWALAKEHV